MRQKNSDCFILIGTTGMVAPANMIPVAAKKMVQKSLK